ncbi:unnamed protein product [Pylaiella littoralis]
MKIPCSVAFIFVAGSPQGGSGFIPSPAGLRKAGGGTRKGNMRMAGWQPREDTKTWGRDSGGGGGVSDPRSPAPAAPASVSDPRAPPRVSDPRAPAGGGGGGGGGGSSSGWKPREDTKSWGRDSGSGGAGRVSDPRAAAAVSSPAVSSPAAARVDTPPPPAVAAAGGGGGGSGQAGAGFAAAFSNVEQALQLSPMDHAEAMGLEAWEVAGNSGTIAGYQGKKVDWVSRCSFQEADGSSRECLRAWVMPMFDVPHLSITIGSGPSGLTAEMDLVAKDDLMYAKGYREQYYGGQVSAWWAALMNNPNITPTKVSMDLKARALDSPMHFSVTMPDTAENAAVLGKAAEDLTSAWLGFLDGAQEIARVRRGTMLGRDSELRRLWWAAASADKALGDRGGEIAAGMAGPGDMGYTGQAS